MMDDYAKEYSVALYDLATEENAEEAMLEQLKVTAQAIGENPAFVALLHSPNLQKAERVQMIEQVFGEKAHPYLLNFLKILTEKRQVSLLPRCYEAYEALYYQRHGILIVTAVTAVPMKEEAQKRLVGKLEAQTGKRIFLKNKIDPSCIGGVKLVYDGKQTDASVKNWMDQLQNSLKKLECKLEESW